VSIQDKKTYGEQYWALQVEATSLYDENVEKAFASYFGGLLADIPSISDLPSGMQTFVRTLAEPPSAGFGGFALGVGVETIDEILHNAMTPLMKMMSRAINKRSKETWLTSEQANTLFARGKITQPLWNEVLTSEGYEDILGKFLYTAQKPYPTIPDIMKWARYHTDPYNTYKTVIDKFDVDATDFEMWEWLTKIKLTVDQLQSLYKRGLYSKGQFELELARIGYDNEDLPAIKDLAYLIPNAMLLVQGGLMQGIDNNGIIENINKADIHPDYAEIYLDAILTKPSSQDIIAYQLRQDPELSGLSGELRRIGIHPKYHNVYKQLAYQIPPVADIITMAVREAFSPEIAARFGQYEDLPDDFVKYAGQKGLSREWASRYWAAHWTLPSPMQGFDMLHRGIITKDELVMLLRALDVMPFWRDKLVQLAYNVFTRVDVRRMYGAGVLNKEDVYKAYVEQGYDEIKARQLTTFTVVQRLASISGFTSGNIVTAYAKGLITQSNAQQLLSGMGLTFEEVNTTIQAANYKRDWELKALQIDSIEHSYKIKEITLDAARSRLNNLNVPSEQITLLTEKWLLAAKVPVVATWSTAQTITLLKKGIITKARATTELRIIGFDEEHINALIAIPQAQTD